MGNLDTRLTRLEQSAGVDSRELDCWRLDPAGDWAIAQHTGERRRLADLPRVPGRMLVLEEVVSSRGVR